MLFRSHFEIVAWSDGGEEAWPPERCAPGQRGRVLFHRLDASCLLVGVVERDEAELVDPSQAALELGSIVPGLRDPRPPAHVTPRLQLGLY